MKKRNVLVYFDDIIESMENIEEYIEGHTFDTFQTNKMVFDAVIRNLEVIGEASKNVPDDIRERYEDIPWQRMVGLRNILIHEYFGINKQIVWKIITENLPDIKPKVKQLLNEL